MCVVCEYYDGKGASGDYNQHKREYLKSKGWLYEKRKGKLHLLEQSGVTFPVKSLITVFKKQGIDMDFKHNKTDDDDTTIQRFDPTYDFEAKTILEDDHIVPIQKDEWVNYSWTNCLVAFDVNTAGDDREWCPMYWADARNLIESAGLEYVPVVAKMDNKDDLIKWLKDHDPVKMTSNLITPHSTDRQSTELINIEGYVVRRYDPQQTPVLRHLKYTRFSVIKLDKAFEDLNL